jgi:opacity protein-like surface antigen
MLLSHFVMRASLLAPFAVLSFLPSPGWSQPAGTAETDRPVIDRPTNGPTVDRPADHPTVDRPADRRALGEGTMAAPRERVVIERHDRLLPGETYVGAFGGYTFGHSFNDVRGLGVGIENTRLGDRDLKNSGIYGVKAGYFLPDRWRWLGFETEVFNTTPHIEQGAAGQPGIKLGVTTVTFNAVVRGLMACRDDRHRDVRDTRRSPAEYRTDADTRFCPLQPYAGVGLGLFFARAQGPGGRSSDYAQPGLNAMVGLRYFVTEHVALFGEYKYNYATFRFEDISGPGVGMKGGYSVSNVIGGISFHF